ncbi:hypothetical protein ASF17_15020 [Frigoribacterium sp. Leaf263]|nr:hypothetical protein ASF17_15020 [Frigoribacterium sp. Leaf263]
MQEGQLLFGREGAQKLLLSAFDCRLGLPHHPCPEGCQRQRSASADRFVGISDEEASDTELRSHAPQSLGRDEEEPGQIGVARSRVAVDEDERSVLGA